jgi:hypothetical protein
MLHCFKTNHGIKLPKKQTSLVSYPKGNAQISLRKFTSELIIFAICLLSSDYKKNAFFSSGNYFYW